MQPSRHLTGKSGPGALAAVIDSASAATLPTLSAALLSTVEEPKP